MTTTPTTIATRIATLLDNGENWYTEDGRTLEALCEAYGACQDLQFDSIRYEFPDGSAIVASGGGWDFGYPTPATCHCWETEGHYCDER